MIQHIPSKISDAVRLIEGFVKEQTMRDDWSIGPICSRKATERLMKEKAEQVAENAKLVSELYAVKAENASLQARLDAVVAAKKKEKSLPAD